MAFDTYANLQTEILAKLNRAGDTDAVARCPSWITLAEDEMRMALNRLSVRHGEIVNALFTIGAQYTALPSGFLRFRKDPVILDTNPTTSLEYVPPKVMDGFDPDSNGGTPRYYTIEGNQIRVYPSPDQSYNTRLVYFSLASLSDSNTYNWLLLAHPKLYFVAALAEAYAYYDDGEKWAAAQADRDRLLTAISISDSSDWQGSSMRIRNDSGNP